jgi:hypothetical protein
VSGRAEGPGGGVVSDRATRADHNTCGWRSGAVSGFSSVVALAAAGAIGLLVQQPWIFPSLGPTIMVMAETPAQPAARPWNVLSGHLVGVVTGYLALLVTGLSQAPPATQQGLTVPRIVAACLSLAVTALVLQILHLPHPPAGATTLLVSLGILTTPIQLLTIVLSVLLITIVMTMINKGRR